MSEEKSNPALTSLDHQVQTGLSCFFNRCVGQVSKFWRLYELVWEWYLVVVTKFQNEMCCGFCRVISSTGG